MSPSADLMIQTCGMLSVDPEIGEEGDKCLDEYLTSKSGDLAGILEDTQVKIFDISGEILNKRSVLLNEDQLGERLNQLHGYLVLLTKMEKAGIFFLHQSPNSVPKSIPERCR